MDEESTQDERSEIAEEPAPGVDETLEDKRLSNENEPASKENVDLSYQSVSPVEAQNAIGKASIPKRRRAAIQIVLYTAFLLVGIVLGVVGMLLFQLSIGGTRSPITSGSLTPVASGNVTVHADQSVITPLLENSVQSIDLPANGSVSNVQIQFTSGSQMNITGNYQVSVLGIPVTQPFSLDAQLIVDNCQVQVHILQADFSNISVTGLVALFEDKINQKLAQLIPQNNLPGNVELCLINIATDEQGISATFDLVVPPGTPTAKLDEPEVFGISFL